MKKIGIITSGGDCAGLNAVLRAVTLRAAQYNWSVTGIRYSTCGFLSTPIDSVPLTIENLPFALLRMGGTMLGSISKGHYAAYPMADGTVKDRTQDILNAYQELGLEALIVVGGDGSHALVRELAQKGNWNIVAIPKTIDNDLGSTEHAIGFHTAVEIATEALDRLQPTAASHDRVMILEVMGRDAGHIALHAGIAGGADIILIPEIAYTMENIANKLKQLQNQGRRHALVVVAEALKTPEGSPLVIEDMEGRKRYGGIGHYMAERIAHEMNVETRVTVLGHVQRGGQPIASDRILASIFGVHAVDLIHQGKFDRMVTWKNQNVTDMPITDAVNHYQKVEMQSPLIRTARGLGICLGDC